MKPVAVCPNFGFAGRLGNQICQAGTTIAMAERHATTPCFHDDWKYRHIYQFPPDWFAGEPVRAACAQVVDLPELVDLTEPLKDYLQDLRWWEPSMPTIREAFTLAAEPAKKIERIWDLSFARLPKPWGVVHVRRGDNVTNDPGTINCLPGSYYREAMALWPHVKSWMVFSDDPGWCRSRFGHRVATVFDGMPRSKERHPDYWTEPVLDWVDLELMRRAVREDAVFVASNSSYALTVATLEEATKVVYPSYWYGAVLTEDLGARPDLLFPEWLAGGWTRIDVGDPNPRKGDGGC